MSQERGNMKTVRQYPEGHTPDYEFEALIAARDARRAYENELRIRWKEERTEEPTVDKRREKIRAKNARRKARKAQKMALIAKWNAERTQEQPSDTTQQPSDITQQPSHPMQQLHYPVQVASDTTQQPLYPMQQPHYPLQMSSDTTLQPSHPMQQPHYPVQMFSDNTQQSTNSGKSAVEVDSRLTRVEELVEHLRFCVADLASNRSTNMLTLQEAPTQVLPVDVSNYTPPPTRERY